MLFRMHPDVAAIVMDACVPNADHAPLVKHIGDIQQAHHRLEAPKKCQMLLKAGCNHRVSKREYQANSPNCSSKTATDLLPPCRPQSLDSAGGFSFIDR